MKLSVDDMEEDGKRGKVSLRGQPLVELGFAAGTSTQITVTLSEPGNPLCNPQIILNSILPGCIHSPLYTEGPPHLSMEEDVGFQTLVPCSSIPTIPKQSSSSLFRVPAWDPNSGNQVTGKGHTPSPWVRVAPRPVVCSTCTIRGRCGTCQTLSLNLTTALHAEPQSQLRRPASLSIRGAKRYGGRPDLDICNVAGVAKRKGSGHVLQEGQCQIKDANKYPRIFFKDENTDLQKEDPMPYPRAHSPDRERPENNRHPVLQRENNNMKNSRRKFWNDRQRESIQVLTWKCFLPHRHILEGSDPTRISPSAFLCWEKPGKAETEGNGDQKAYTGWFLREILGMMCVQNEKEETAANMYAFVEVMYPKCWYSLAKTRQQSGLEKILMQHGILSQCRGNTQIASPG
ncbi:hypothetical protein MJT46_016337 [Ovis ammon polii x Ovis aries]|nr:hypothetical protein MJT46_016337 [Ovis ammon polii x Ovis aries]